MTLIPYARHNLMIDIKEDGKCPEGCAMCSRQPLQSWQLQRGTTEPLCPPCDPYEKPRDLPVQHREITGDHQDDHRRFPQVSG